jgi:hypothetical protein
VWKSGASGDGRLVSPFISLSSDELHASSGNRSVNRDGASVRTIRRIIARCEISDVANTRYLREAPDLALNVGSAEIKIPASRKSGETWGTQPSIFVESSHQGLKPAFSGSFTRC